MIPKIFMQTSRQKPQQYVVDMIRERCPGWTYEHYTDDDIIAFFGENPVPEFPNVIAKFYMLNYGEHRADLFRYYFLYVKGGVYMDLDAMNQCPIENIIGNADFFTVNSSYFPGTVFQGFLGATPKHPLIYQALKDIYHCPLENLRKEFHLLCKNLYGFIQEQRTEKTLLLEEVYGGCEEEAHVLDKDKKVVLIHYHIKKIIPLGYN
jgi:mannosyltransferase OCH1-like enzyme